MHLRPIWIWEEEILEMENLKMTLRMVEEVLEMEEKVEVLEMEVKVEVLEMEVKEEIQRQVMEEMEDLEEIQRQVMEEDQTTMMMIITPPRRKIQNVPRVKKLPFFRLLVSQLAEQKTQEILE
jgi:hypothetical protein